MKYCRLEVFREEYFMHLTSGHETNRKTTVISLKKTQMNYENLDMSSRSTGPHWKLWVLTCPYTVIFQRDLNIYDCEFLFRLSSKQC